MQFLYLSIFFVGTFINARSFNAADIECFSPPTQKDFDLEKFLGIWYVAELSPKTLTDVIQCSTDTYAKAEIEGEIAFNFTGIDSRTHEVGVEEGFVFQEDPETPGSLSTYTPNTFKTSKMLILSTDYETYAVSYSCEEFYSYPKEEYMHLIKIYTKQSIQQKAILKKAHEEIKRAGLGSISHEIGSLKEVGC